ncbi:MAG TPA: hypothetical protein VIG74_01965 [Alphaproteobacteria bacterium]
MGILEKPAADLSADDLKDIIKELGADDPYPMQGLGYVLDAKNGMKVSRYLGTLARPLKIYSERSAEEVEGMLRRSMPTPEMLPLLFDLASAMRPGNKRRVMFLKGAPGAGKTFVGELMGAVASKKGAVTVDCTGLNLNELFYETVLDFKKGERFYDALDKKIALYNEHVHDPDVRDSTLNPMSVDILRDCMGEAFIEEGDGRISIDWGRVKQSHKGPDGHYLTSRECAQIAVGGLEQVSEKENMNGTGGNTLGYATQRGVAWQTYKSGQVLILDELNRAKPGTFGVLHGWLQMINGEKPSYRKSNNLKEKGDKANQSLHFTARDMAAGHFVFMTGNMEDDGSEVQELSEALSSRVVPRPVPRATEMGWQHRLCQVLTGYPVSTEYYANRDAWEKEPGSFDRHLQKWRHAAEDQPVPIEHEHHLRRWRNTLEATENLAKFLESASKVVNPDSDWHKRTTSLAQLMEEISEGFKKELAIDFRKINYFLNVAYQDKPAVRRPEQGSPNAPDIIPFISAEDAPETQEEVNGKIGTYLTYVIVDWIVSNTFERGKDGVGRQLLQLAQDCALLKPTLKDAKLSNRKTVAELLDDNPLHSDQPDIQAGVVRDMLCQHLRNIYPGIKADNNALMSVAMVQRALEKTKEDTRNAMRENNGVCNNVVLFNDDPDWIYTQPLRPVAVFDHAAGQKPAVSELSSRQALLYALAAPALRQQNLAGLSTQSFSSLLEGNPAEGSNPADPAIAMAEARNSDFGVTTVMTNKNDKAEPLHIIWNKRSNAVLVVGKGDLTPDLQKIFNRTCVSYVNRDAKNAADKAETGLRMVMGAEGAGQENYLKRAFLLRSCLPNPEEEKKISLVQLLVRSDLDPYLPVYVMNRSPEPKAA